MQIRDNFAGGTRGMLSQGQILTRARSRGETTGYRGRWVPLCVGRGTVGATALHPPTRLRMMGCGRAGFTVGLLSPHTKLVFLLVLVLPLLSARRGTGFHRLQDGAPTQRWHGTPRCASKLGCIVPADCSP